MPNIVVVGTQWGDEGKGKVVDMLAPHVNVVARFAGGNNAGHTVVVGREKYVLHSIPSGILHPGCRCVIGCGVVVDPGSLIEEMEALVRRGVTLDGNLFISKNAHLIMPYHPALDLASEAKLGKRRIGTTGRGVGPAYVDKAARVGIRMADLLNERLFREKLEMNVTQKNRLLREIYDAETFTVEEILDKYLRYAGWLAPYITDTALLLSRWMEAGYSVMFEGAQATMLDIDHGTYPYITSSSDDRRWRGDRHGRAAHEDPRRRRREQSLYDARRRRAVPHRDVGRDRRDDPGARPRVRRHHRPAAALRLVRRGGRPLRDAHQRPRHRRADQARRARRVRDPEGLRRVSAPRRDPHRVPGGRDRGGGGRARLRGDRGLAGADRSAPRTRPICRRRRGATSSALEELIGAPFCLISTGAQRDETILCEDSPLMRWFPSVSSSLM